METTRMRLGWEPAIHAGAYCQSLGAYYQTGGHTCARGPVDVYVCAALCLGTFGGMSRDYAGPRYGHGAYCDAAMTDLDRRNLLDRSDDIANIAY